MRIAYYSAAFTGCGNTVRGIAIRNALQRAAVNCEFVMVGTLGMAGLAESQGIAVVQLEPESFDRLAAERFRSSATYQTLSRISADILIVDLAWFTTQRMVAELPGNSVLLLRQASADFFGYYHNGTTTEFDPSAYDLVLSIEPCSLPFETVGIDPIIMRQPHELLTRARAAAALGLDPDQPAALIATNGKPGEFEKLRQTYSCLDGDYQLFCSSNHHGGVFPIVDYFNAFDLVVCSGGYNAFWEAVYFSKDAVFVPHARRFENQAWRIENCQDYVFRANGADELVKMLLNAG
ncbi:MAG: hypothetical protein EA404_15260 [Spirochaetaceae bacterium]|nr:MAG: hypothetical protein EA404_15260 [Spirochaetaceae bacterium]